MSRIRSVLFDLGGVLVRFRGVERVAQWSGDGEVAEEHWRRWLGSDTVRQFELGRLSSERFADGLIEEFRLALSPAAALDEVRDFVGGPLAGAAELLDELRGQLLVACLSNTNSLHWPKIVADLGLERRLHRAFLSFETGLLKPDAEAFEHVCQELALEPGEILFFDDAPPNIEAARALGFAACRARGPRDCRRELERRGLLPAC